MRSTWRQALAESAVSRVAFAAKTPGLPGIGLYRPDGTLRFHSLGAHSRVEAAGRALLSCGGRITA
jgi:hypothetical protein